MFAGSDMVSRVRHVSGGQTWSAEVIRGQLRSDRVSRGHTWLVEVIHGQQRLGMVSRGQTDLVS